MDILKPLYFIAMIHVIIFICNFVTRQASHSPDANCVTYAHNITMSSRTFNFYSPNPLKKQIKLKRKADLIDSKACQNPHCFST